MKKEPRKRKPTSVGEMLSEEFLIPMGLTQKQFANHLEIDIKTVNRIVNNRTSLTTLLALKIAAALGTSAEFWINLQVENDIWKLQNSDLKLPSKISA